MNICKYALGAFNVALKPENVNVRPLYFQLEPTTLCNLNCRMCSRNKKIEKHIVPTIKHMSLAEFKKIFQEISPCRIQLSGQGEPAMNPDLIGMISFASKNGAKVSTISNFILPDEEYIENLVKSGLNLLKVSVDAATRETYLKIRGVDEFDKVLNNIRLVNKKKKALGVKKPFIRLQFCMLKDNYRELTPLIRLAKDLEVDAIYFQALELTDFEEHTDELMGDLKGEDLKNQINTALEEAKALNVSTNLDDIAKDFEDYWRKYQWGKDKEHAQMLTTKQICLLPWFAIYITVDGEVKPCCRFSREAISFGNLFEKPFDEIWNGARFRKFRQSIKSGRLDYNVCRDCVIKDFGNILKLRNILPGILK